MNMRSLRKTFEELLSLTRELSPTTRVILAGYALYVVGFWIFAVAPGEIAFEGATTTAVDGHLGQAVSIVRADDRWVVVDIAAQDERPAAIAVVDLDHGIDDDAIVAQVPGVGWARNAAVRDGVVHVLAESADGRSAMTVTLQSGTADVRAVDPRSLWVLPDGTVTGHGLIDWLVEETWNVSVADVPAVVSGDHALLRVAASDGQRAPDGTWSVTPSASEDDFVIVDAHNTEPLQRVDTYNLDYIGPSPGRSGFLYIAQGFPGFVWCPEAGCEDRSVHVRTETHPIAAIDHRHDIGRIAVCTPSEVYLYEGEPGEEEIIFLGRTDLEAPCESLAVVDGQTVWIAAAGTTARLVRFMQEGGT